MFTAVSLGVLLTPRARPASLASCERSSVVAAVGTSVSARAWRVRIAERADLLPAAMLMQDAFSGEGRTFLSPNERGWVEIALTTARLALDIERRATPWDWARHAQFVACKEDGQLLGFVEVWGEDAESAGNLSAATPQPSLFNLCVSPSARRMGVARALVEACEMQCAEWGDPQLFLKVRTDNAAADLLYRSLGYESCGLRDATGVPDWQTRWKGGLVPLQLLRKTVPRLTMQAGEPQRDPVPTRRYSEYKVTLDQVRAYDERDAYIWFTLLVARNLGSLTPTYRLLPLVAVAAGLVTYRAAVETAHILVR